MPTQHCYTHLIGMKRSPPSPKFHIVGPFGKANTRRQKVARACVFCQRSHMTCDVRRPCQRCVRRRIGHLCHDSHDPQLGDSPRQSSVPSLSDDASLDSPEKKLGDSKAVSHGEVSMALYEEWFLPHAAIQMKFLDCDELCSRLTSVCDE